MRRSLENLQRTCDLFERGIVSDIEFAHSFLEISDPPSAVTDWMELPETLQAVVKSYLERHPADSLQAFLIGRPFDGSKELLERASAHLRETARMLERHWSLFLH